MKVLRKTLALLMILTFCAAIMAGCKGNTIVSPKAPSTAPAENSTTNSDIDSSGKVIKSGTIQKDGNVILKELAFVYNGNTFAISDIVDDEKLESILGKAEEKKSHTYSNDDGLNMDTLIGFTEKQYQFPGLSIKTINETKSSDFYIFSINIIDPKYSTVRNIKVGDSLDKLKEAYPEGNLLGDGTGEEDDFQYQPVNYVDGMKFHIKNSKIESIMMYKLLD
ncbi:MAG: hypothetical protein K0R80_557 [Clostridia bacterium]|jgi:hypothetical protein|nr:hypothetical protein [Clostridia bacterium]